MASFFAYALLLFFATLKHTFWRDEAEAWMVARSSSTILSLLHNARYEGHPPLWYLVLYGLSRFSWNPDWMKLPNFLFAIVAVALILSAFRLSLPVRLGLTFSYYMLFEYGLLTRNYMFGIVFLLVAVTLLRRKDMAAAGVWVPILLSVSALTSLPALLVSFCLFLFYLYTLHEALPKRNIAAFVSSLGVSRFLALGFFTVCCFVSAATIRPPADSGLMLDRVQQPPGLPPILMRFGRMVTDAFFPIPHLTHRFWNDTITQRLPFHLGGFFGIALAVVLVFYFRDRLVRTLYLGTSALLILQMMFSGRTFLRHTGWLFLIFLLSLILEAYRTEPAPRIQTTRWRGILLAAVLIVQVAAAGFAITMSFLYPFSSSKLVAEYLKQHHLDTGPLTAEPFLVIYPVLAYMERGSAFDMERQTESSLVIWNRQEFLSRRLAPSPEELRALTRNGVRPVLITAKPLSSTDLARLDLTLLISYTDSICTMDDYYLYR